LFLNIINKFRGNDNIKYLRGSIAFAVLLLAYFITTKCMQIETNNTIFFLEISWGQTFLKCKFLNANVLLTSLSMSYGIEFIPLEQLTEFFFLNIHGWCNYLCKL